MIQIDFRRQGIQRRQGKIHARSILDSGEIFDAKTPENAKVFIIEKTEKIAQKSWSGWLEMNQDKSPKRVFWNLSKLFDICAANTFWYPKSEFFQWQNCRKFYI